MKLALFESASEIDHEKIRLTLNVRTHDEYAILSTEYRVVHPFATGRPVAALRTQRHRSCSILFLGPYVWQCHCP